MKLNTRTRYGTRLLLDLAENFSGNPLHIADIAKRQNITAKYLEQIVRPLKKARMVTSIRGPKGGHLLALSPEKISLGQIVRLLENDEELVECGKCPEVCTRSDDCRVRLAWLKASEALFEELDSISLLDLMEMNGDKVF